MSIYVPTVLRYIIRYMLINISKILVLFFKAEKENIVSSNNSTILKLLN